MTKRVHLPKLECYARMLREIYGQGIQILTGRPDELIKVVDETLKYAGEPHFNHHDRRKAIAILRDRYGLDDCQPKTLADVGENFLVSGERIRAVVQNTKHRLRHSVYRQRLSPFVYRINPALCL